MMDKALISQLQAWAKEYNNPEFIHDDPSQFPHRFSTKQDIEISGFLAAWLAFGRREHINAKAEELLCLMKNSPYEFIMNAPVSLNDIKDMAERTGSRNTFYRFYTYGDVYKMLRRLHEIYSRYDSLEDAVIDTDGTHVIKKLSLLFEGIRGIPAINGNSACKKLAMFLRWMIRNDSIVDMGIWKNAASPEELVIPLDTHVFQLSKELGIIQSNSATWKTAVEITEALKEAFPGDPCLGDFALFGYDITKKKLNG